MHATMWVYQQPMDETIDGDSKEKAVTTFLGQHHVSLFISWIHLYTLHEAPHCACVFIVDTRKEEEMKQEVTSQIRERVSDSEACAISVAQHCELDTCSFSVPCTCTS